MVDGVREVLRLEAEGGVSDVGGSALSLEGGDGVGSVELQPRLTRQDLQSPSTRGLLHPAQTPGIRNRIFIALLDTKITT